VASLVAIGSAGKWAEVHYAENVQELNTHGLRKAVACEKWVRAEREPGAAALRRPARD